MLILSLGFLLATAGSGWGQCNGVDVDLQAVQINPSAPVISTTGTAQIFVEMRNNGPCVIPTGEARFTVTFSDQYLQPAAVLGVLDGCAPARWTHVITTQSGGFYNLTFRNDAGPLPVGGAPCAVQFNIGGRGLVSPAPQQVTLVSSLTALATTGDVNPFNQNANTFITVSMVAPVILADITATDNSCNGVLDWRTTSEDNVSRFEVQYSQTPSNWQTVGTVAAKGNGNGASYKYVNNQGSTRGYYRLLIVDRDGTVSYSKIVTVETRCTGKKSINVYPNPLTVNQNLNVVATGFEGSIKGELVSMSGQIVRTYVLKNGSNVLPIDKISQATYMLRVSDAAGDAENFRLVIIK